MTQNTQGTLELVDLDQVIAIYNDWEDLLHNTGTTPDQWQRIASDVWQRDGSPDIQLRLFRVTSQEQ